MYVFIFFEKKGDGRVFGGDGWVCGGDGGKNIFSAGIGFLKKIKCGSEGFIHGP